MMVVHLQGNAALRDRLGIISGFDLEGLFLANIRFTFFPLLTRNFSMNI